MICAHLHGFITAGEPPARSAQNANPQEPRPGRRTAPDMVQAAGRKTRASGPLAWISATYYILRPGVLDYRYIFTYVLDLTN